MSTQGHMNGEDRYTALGVPYPDPETMCKGQCEGLGVYPHREPDRLLPEIESQFTPERRVERERWLEAHNTPDAHEADGGQCDGYHFIKCPDCGGTGKLTTTQQQEGK